MLGTEMADPVRPGHELILGATPLPGERVWLTNLAVGLSTYRSGWFEVVRVESASLLDHAFLVGYYPDRPWSIQREYVRRDAVRVERRCLS